MKRMDVDLDAAFTLGSQQEPTPRRTHSPRSNNEAKELWKRFNQWYGVRWSDNFGPKPSDDWIAAFEGTTDGQVARARGLIRQRHPVHPPTLGQFEAILRDAREQATQARAGNSMLDRLTALAARRSSERQRVLSWTYHTGRSGEIDAVTVPAAGQVPEFRVTANDLAQEGELR